MKAALLLICGLIFAFVIVGVMTLQRSVIVLSIPLLAYVLAAIIQRPDEIRLLVSRELTPEYAAQGTPVTVKLRLLNQGAALDEIAVEDQLPGGITRLDGDVSRLSRLEAGEHIELAYRIEARRGSYEVYEVVVHARDFLGFFERSLVYRTYPQLVAHPRYAKLDRIRIRPPQTRGFAGPIGARQAGAGIDFWSVREYQSGDPQRHLNWRRAARSEDQLFTNIFEQERVADVGVILDARQRSNVSVSSTHLFEYSVRAAADLAVNFLTEGNRVSLLVYGAEMTRVFPGYGRLHQDRILKALARARPGINYALENLAYLPTRMFPAKSQLVLVSPLLPDDIAVIMRMRAQGYAVMVISPDPISFEAAFHQDYHSPAYRMAFAERQLMLRRAHRGEVQIVNWRVDQPLELVLRQSLSRQPSTLRINRLGMG